MAGSKRVAADAAEEVLAEAVEADDAEARAAKKADKKAKKASAAAAAQADAEPEEDAEAATLAAKKAAKKAKKAAAAVATPEVEETTEDMEADARAAKKAAKKAAKAAAAPAEEDAESPPPKKKKEEPALAETPPPKEKKEDELAQTAKKEEVAKAADDEEWKDNTYKCCDCDQDWIDTADDQAFRWDKGFAETPKRCKDCRWAKKVRMEGGDPTGKGKGNKELEVFIGGLPFGTTEDVLRKDFEDCGEIANFRMPLNDEGACRGIAFCEYATKEGVEKALKFDQTEYGGRTLSVRMSGDDKGKGKGKGKDGKGKGNKEFEVFIGGLPFATTEGALKKDFAECGDIVNFRMPLNDEGNARGIAFIEFKDKESCEKALKFHETDYGGRSLSVKMSGDGGGKGKDDKGKGKGKKGKKGKAPSEAFAKNTGCIVTGAGEKKTFDSDSE